MNHHIITLTPGLARVLLDELQAVLDGEATYFHAELTTDSGLPVGLHLSGPQDEQPMPLPQRNADDWTTQMDADQWGVSHG